MYPLLRFFSHDQGDTSDRGGNGLVNNAETKLGHKPCRADTDGDGIADGQASASSNRLSPAQRPQH